MGKKNQRARQRDQRRQAKAARAQCRAQAARARRHGKAQSRVEAATALRRAAEDLTRALPEGPITGLTARFGDNDVAVTSTPIAAEDVGAWQTYLDAHTLLPCDYHLGGPIAEALAEEAFEVIAKEDAPAVAWLRSIVLLGHTPTAAALEALNHHATSGQPLADIARMAADECAEWMSHEAGAGRTTDLAN